MKLRLFIAFIGMVLANFLVQAFYAEPNWLVALERSFVQGLALFNFWLFDTFIWYGEK